MAQVMLIPIGSAGDVHPYVGIGQALQARGHRAVLVCNPTYETLARRAGLDFIGVGSAQEFQETVNDPHFWEGPKGAHLFFDHLIKPMIRGVYDVVAQQHTADTVLVASGVAFGARIAHDKLGVPLATIYLQPAFMPSLHRDSIGPGFLLPRWLPMWCRRLCFWMVNYLSDREILPEVNALRTSLGLAPVRQVFNTWDHSPQRVLGLWPDWLCPLQPDWPAQTRLTGFPLFNDSNVADLPEDLHEYLEAGTPPVVFTAGTAMAHAESFFQESVAACRLTGRRGILLTKFPKQLPAQLPEGVRHFDYIPFPSVLPRAAALVHHGGIGTTAQALVAGIPQLIVPFAVDQPDNAAMLSKLGVALSLKPRAYRAPSAAAALQSLLTGRTFQDRCLAISQRVRSGDPVAAACQLIEELLPESSPRVSR